MKYILLMLLTCSFAYSQNTIVYDKENNLAFDIYYPTNFQENQSYNILAWVHGGGFSGGSRNDVDEVKRMKDAQSRGYVAISISYRLLANSPKGFGCDLPKKEKLYIFKEAAFDVLNALNYIQSNQKSLKININKLILGGSSAGAETILNAHYLRNIWFGNSFNHIKIDGLISYAGAIVDDRFISNYNIVPTVFIHGLKDDVVPAYNFSHRSCGANQEGFMPLVGDFSLQNTSIVLQTPSFSIYSKNGKHEWSGLRNEYLNEIFSFIDNSILKGFNETIIKYVD